MDYKNLSIAYHIKAYEKFTTEYKRGRRKSEHEKMKMDFLEDHPFDFWVVFTEVPDTQKSEINYWELQAEDYLWNYHYDPEIRQAIEDQKNHIRWKEDLYTTLNIYDEEFKEDKYTVDNKEYSHRKIWCWQSEITKSTSKSRPFNINHLVFPNTNKYKIISRECDLGDEKKTLIASWDDEHNKMYQDFVLVVNEITEIRKSHLSRNGEYELYRIDENCHCELIEKSNVNSKRNEREKSGKYINRRYQI